MSRYDMKPKLTLVISRKFYEVHSVHLLGQNPFSLNKEKLKNAAIQLLLFVKETNLSKFQVDDNS